MKKLFVLPIIIGMFGFALLQGMPTYAQNQSTIAISPLTFEITANPGDVITNAARVFNPGQEPIAVLIHMEDFSPSGETGQAVVEAAESTTYSIASWTALENTDFVLGPGEQGIVNFTIRVPLNAEPGGHYGALTVEGRGGAIAGGPGVSISQKVAALILIAVAGDVQEELAITDFVGPGNLVLDASALKFASRFENRGTVHLKPRGFVVIHNAFGREIATLALDQKNVLPQSKRVIETDWNPDGFVMGRFNAQLTAIYGSTNEPLAASTSFWVIPVRTVGPIAGAAFVLLVLAVVLRKRLAFAFSILVRGQRSS